MTTCKRAATTTCLLVGCLTASGSNRDSLTLESIYAYGQRVQKPHQDTLLNVYTLCQLRTLKKNKTLIAVPTLYSIARKKNTYFVSETYSRVHFIDNKSVEETRQLIVGTMPRHRQAMPTMLDMLTPNPYGVTLLSDHLLSPFHRKNWKFYRYGFRNKGVGTREVVFIPKTRNTQTVKGRAEVDWPSGRISSITFEGEYDMISFRVHASMSDSLGILPRQCDLDATFHMGGNRIQSTLHTEYGIAPTLPDTLANSHDRQLMDSLRPAALPADAQSAYHRADSLEQAQQGAPPKDKRKNMVRHVLWDMIGDNLVNRIKGNFGNNDQGFFKIYPILDPLSLSYSGKKGVTYKFRFRANYNFTPEQEVSLYFRGGYSFKQDQFYFRLPLKYMFSRRNDGYVLAEVGNGNRITNSSIKNDVIDEHHEDSAHLAKAELDYFKDTYMKIRSNYNLNDLFSLGLGFTFHRRSAVNKTAFHEAHRPTTYHSMAPMIEAKVRPWGWRGPIITVDYEQGLKGIGKANTRYGRLETDAIWLRKFHRLRSFSFRLGAGIYTMKDKDAYFLDFENFRANNMPGGWNDDWTGDFQLLSSNTYNSSEYYLRSNMTYESPLFFLSHAPLLGKYVEMERIYVSTLLAKGIHPYTEWGYGLTNRLFSIGLFVATRNGKYDGIGCRMGIELFRDW